MKGITPIISIIVLLAITIALVGTAYSFIFGYIGGYTSKFIEIGPSSYFCRNGVVTVFIQNAGTDTIIVSSQLGQTKEYIPDINTVALWHFNDGSGTVALDSSIYGNDGFLYNGLDSGWSTGRFGSGLTFDGINDALDATGFSFNTTDWTVELWINAINETPFGLQGLINNRYGGQDTAFRIVIVFSSFVYELYNGAVSTGGGGILNIGSWTHIAISYDESTDIARFYVNGNEVDNLVIPNINSHPNISLGALTGIIEGWFNGSIDEVRISNITRDFTQPQQGWSYTCTGLGDTYSCGDILITRTSGAGTFTPSFESSILASGKSIKFIDSNCLGKCGYIFALISNSKKIEMNC